MENKTKATVFLDGDIICGVVTKTTKRGIILENIDHDHFKHFSSLFINKDKIIAIGYKDGK